MRRCKQTLLDLVVLLILMPILIVAGVLGVVANLLEKK